MSRLNSVVAGAAAAVVALSACGQRPVAATQFEAMDASMQRLYVADGRNCLVRVFDMRNGPVALATTHAPCRGAIRGLRLDERRGRLWLLGADMLCGYDAHTLAAVTRRPLPSNTGPQRDLDLDPDGAPVLVSAGRRYRVEAT